jgi:hypothetical protein
MTGSLSRLAAIVALAAAAFACDENPNDVTSPTPGLEPTLSSIQREIFNQTDSRGRQACINCHSGSVPQGDLTLTDGQSYGQLVNRASAFKPGATRVVPGDPSNSYLVQKLEGASGLVGDRMPVGGPYLTADQVSVIREWIQRGAPND